MIASAVDSAFLRLAENAFVVPSFAQLCWYY